MRGTVVSDTYARTVSSGWGSATSGQAWTTLGTGGTVLASDWNVAAGVGTMSVPATVAFRACYLATFNEPDVDVRVTVTVPVVPTGAPIEVGNLMLRGTTTTTTYYLLRAQIETDNTVSLLIFDRSGTQLGTTKKVLNANGTNWLPAAGNTMTVAGQAIGSWLRLKAWHISDPEPVAWVSALDPNAYTGAGWIGTRCGIASGNTNTKPIVFTFDNFTSSLVNDFPNDKLPVQVLFAPGAVLTDDYTTWPWVDITADVRQANGQKVVISPFGRGDETSTTQPAGCAFQLGNSSGDYSVSPLPKYYPFIRQNTPVWVLIGSATRFFGYANGFTPGYDTSGKQATAIVSVSASGNLRRLAQGKSPVQSPLRRAILGQSTLRAYWPLEDAAGSTSIASAVPGGAPMTVTDASFASDSTEPGSAPLPVMSSTSEIGGPVSGSFASQWQADWYYKVSDPKPNVVKILSVFTTDVSGGSGLHWDVTVGHATLDGIVSVVATRLDNNAEVVNVSLAFGAGYFDQWIHGRLMAHQSGGNIEWALVLFPLVGSGGSHTATVAGTVGGVFFITIPQQTNLAGLATGHIAVFDNYNLGAADAAQSGFTGELVTTRLQRLCAENGETVTIHGTSTTLMGGQGVDTFVNLLRACEAADLGVLYDGASQGLDYVTRAARENVAAALTLDATAGEVAPPFAPKHDDQRIRNKYTVSRLNGSSATYADTDGPMGTDAIGTYDSTTPQPLNLSSDSVLPGVAQYLVHQGTVEGYRYPALNLDLRRSPEKLAGWLAVAIQSRIDVTNVRDVATQQPPGDVSLLAEGYTESFDPFGLTVAANCSPYQPYRVGELAANSGHDTNEFVFRLEASASTASASVLAGASTFSIATAAGHQLWTTTAAGPNDFPFDVDLDGLRVSVSAITGTTSPQTATVDPSGLQILRAVASGATVKLWDQPGLGL